MRGGAEAVFPKEEGGREQGPLAHPTILVWKCVYKWILLGTTEWEETQKRRLEVWDGRDVERVPCILPLVLASSSLTGPFPRHRWTSLPLLILSGYGKGKSHEVPPGVRHWASFLSRRHEIIISKRFIHTVGSHIRQIIDRTVQLPMGWFKSKKNKKFKPVKFVSVLFLIIIILLWLWNRMLCCKAEVWRNKPT